MEKKYSMVFKGSNDTTYRSIKTYMKTHINGVTVDRQLALKARGSSSIRNINDTAAGNTKSAVLFMDLCTCLY